MECTCPNCNCKFLLIPKRKIDTDVDRVSLILDHVCHHYMVTENTLKAKSRSRKIVNARHVAMYLLYRWAQLNLSEIGRLFYRDHTTVLHAREKFTSIFKTHKDPYNDFIYLDRLMENFFENPIFNEKPVLDIY